MRFLLLVALLFGVLALAFGVWAFGFAAHVAWDGIKIIFWVCVALCVLSLLGWGVGSKGTAT